jgi:DnaK suppressor protein
MAKTKASSTAAKAHKGKTPNKAGGKVDKSKPAAARAAAKSPARAAVKTASKSTPKKAAPAKAAARAPAKKAAAGKSATRSKTPAGKAATKKAPAKKVAVKKAATQKVAVKKAAVKKAPAKKAPAKKTSPGKTTAGKAPVRKVAAKPVVKKPAAGKAPAKAAPRTGAAKKPAASKPAHGKATQPAAPAPKSPAAHAARPEPVAANHHSPSPASRLFKGKVASATAMVSAPGRHAPSHKKSKNSSSPMNKLATKTLDSGVTREDGRYALPSTSTISLPKGYRPSSDEEYMNPRHLAYFRNKLREWREQLVEESRQTMDNLREEVRDVGDEAERATRETENSLELRTRDRYRKLISKIDKALRRIEEGSYGFCEETDEEIGIDRLDARPIATLSLDAQERREHLQKQMGD